MNEKRQYNGTVENDLNIPIRVRGRRRYKGLVDPWDDYMTRVDNRSWKRYRKTQYKVVNK